MVGLSEVKCELSAWVCGLHNEDEKATHCSFKNKNAVQLFSVKLAQSWRFAILV